MALCLTAGSAHAQATFNFLNECGTGVWATTCNPSAGVFRNNWGQSAATSGALVFPGALDTANVLAGGSLTLNSSVSIATLNIPAGATFNWTSGSMTTPSAGVGVGMLNSGMTSITGGTRNFSGTLVNASGATIAIDLNESNIVLTGPVSWTNSGSISFADGTDMTQSGVGARTLTNSGTLSFINPTGSAGAVTDFVGWTDVSNTASGVIAVGNGAGVSIPDTALSSVPTALWTTGTGGTLSFSGTLTGTFVGNHAGSAQINSTVTLLGDTTFALQAGSPNPWRWSGGHINTGVFTLTNTGRMDVPGSTRNFTGTLVNASGATIAIDLNESNIALTGPVSWTNNGSISFADGTDMTQSGAGTRTLTNSGTLSFINPSSVAGAVTDFGGWTSVSNTASGVIAVGNGAGASIADVALSSVPTALWTTATGSTLSFSGTLTGTFVGNHAGAAQIGSTVTLLGDTTFALQAGSPNPWRWSGGHINTGVFTLTNTGRMDVPGVTRNFTGTLVNASGATIAIDLNESNIALNGPVSWTNNGSLSFADGTDTTLFSGVGTRTLTNSGTLSFINPTGSVGAVTDFAGWTSVSNTASGVIFVGNGAAATITTTPTFSHTAGRIEGFGRLNVGGTLTVDAVIAPGAGTGSAASDIGTLTIGTGRMVMTAASELEITLRNPPGSTEPADQTGDKLVIVDTGSPTPPAGAHTLGGVLRVRLAPGTTDVQGGIDYVIVDVSGGGSPNITGNFSQVIDANPLPGIRYSVRTTATQAIMRVIRQCNIADVAGGNQEPLFDGLATADDIIVFLNRYFAGDLRADYAGPNQSIGGDGLLTADDIIVFLSFYFQGCGF